MLFSFFYARTKIKMGQFMNFATSAVCALAISFLLYDQRTLHELGGEVAVGRGGGGIRLAEYQLKPQRGGGKDPFQAGVGGAQATHPFS